MRVNIWNYYYLQGSWNRESEGGWRFGDANSDVRKYERPDYNDRRKGGGFDTKQRQC